MDLQNGLSMAQFKQRIPLLADRLLLFEQVEEKWIL